MRKGEIWLVDLFGGAGREQLGERPAIILASTPLQIVAIIPLTANLKALRFPFVFPIDPNKKNGLRTQSVALVFHVRAIDERRLVKKIGELDKRDIDQINHILKKMLDL